ncbi:MAG: hypothetical protein ACPGJV_11560 [Bacteriovoracaceae bacterium]
MFKIIGDYFGLSNVSEFFGAGDGTQTHDLLHGTGLQQWLPVASIDA